MTQDSIQSIFIKQTETRNDSSKAYTAYRIDVQAAVRQWHIWKRYSDFTKLHDQLLNTFPGVDMPAHLPYKRIFPPTFSAPDRVEDRKQGLEDYLRTIQSYRDDRWRKTDIWVKFLALPNIEAKEISFTFGSWLDEFDDLLSMSRDIRCLINNRNSYQTQQEVSDAMRCDIKAKKDLMTLTARLSNLESSLLLTDDDHVVEGEERRRQDKLNSLKMERDVLFQLVNTAAATSSGTAATDRKKKVASSATHQYGDIGFDLQHHQQIKRAATSPQTIRQGRAFGNAFKQQQQQLQETEFTKGLDNQELLNYQSQVMKDQDLHVEQFSQLLSRQKEIGFAINCELENQIDVLESLDIQVEKTSSKLAFANKKLSKLK